MPDLPPKTLKKQIVRLDHNLKQIERRQFAGIQRAPGSLPVLEAFQEFLDKESLKARKRLMQVTLLFSAIIIAAVAAGGAFIYLQMKRSAVDYAALSAKTEALEESGKASLASLSEMQTVLDENRESRQKLAFAHSNITAIVNNDSKLITDLQQTIKNLEKENQSLKTDIDNFVQDWNSITQKVKKMALLQSSMIKKMRKDQKEKSRKAEESRKPPEEPRYMPSRRSTPAPAPRPRVAASSASAKSINMIIIPKGEETGMRWRLPKINQE